MSAVSRRGLFGLFAGAAVAPLLSRLPARLPAPAVPAITRELQFAAPGMFTRYSGYEVLNITRTDILSAADYSWKAAAARASLGLRTAPR